MRITHDEFIDASDPNSGLARYMNHAKANANVIKFTAQVCSFVHVSCSVSAYLLLILYYSLQILLILYCSLPILYYSLAFRL
jgi:hypothetical protein